MILKKFNEKKYSITHFSDILRMNLLSNHGGIWVDATLYFSGEFTEDIDDKYPLYSRKTEKETKFISNGMWSSYFIASSKKNILLCACYDILCRYWERHNTIIEYLLTDYVFIYYTKK